MTANRKTESETDANDKYNAWRGPLMDRFTLEFPPVAPSASKQERCDDCRDFAPLSDMWMLKEGRYTLFICLTCKRDREERENPPCTCRQTDVDLFDARGCEAHDAVSKFNVEVA